MVIFYQILNLGTGVQVSVFFMVRFLSVNTKFVTLLIRIVHEWRKYYPYSIGTPNLPHKYSYLTPGITQT